MGLERWDDGPGEAPAALLQNLAVRARITGLPGMKIKQGRAAKHPECSGVEEEGHCRESCSHIVHERN